MDELARVREEIRRGNYAVAETMLDTIVDGPEEITSHLLFDITRAYEDLFCATGRYQELIQACHRCAKKARELPSIDVQIHSAHTLIIIAGAERALGRRDDAERETRAAEHALGDFQAERFGTNSRERVNRLRVRLKSLKRAIREDGLPSSKSPAASSHSTAEPGEWGTFASRKNLSGRDVKTYFAKMRRSVGPVESVAIVVEWALSTPRAGSIGASPEAFAVLVEELASVILAQSLPFDSCGPLFQLLHVWQQDSAWLQRLMSVNRRKLGVAEKLQHLRRALEAKVQHALNSIEGQMAALEPLDSGAILDGVGDQDCETLLLRLESELDQLQPIVPSSSSSHLDRLQNHLVSVIARVDQELRRRNEVYEQLLEAIARASSRSALTDLHITAKQQLPAALQARPELQKAFRDADDRILVAELEILENQERSAHRAKLTSVRGVELANLLFREYGVDLPTARKLVIDRNQGNIDIEGLLDKVFEIKRHKHAKN